jgi:hypothetical protein
VHVCTCTETGYLNLPPPVTSPGAKSRQLDDAGLCNFACKRGYCPPPCAYLVPVNFPDNSCSDQWKTMLRGEMSNACEMVVNA